MKSKVAKGIDDLTLQVHLLYPHLLYQSGILQDTSDFILLSDYSQHIPSELRCFA